ncbi:hypothetical protein AMATHDRAFT_148175 [Amanita thiersii Skay4041]|uniref:SET domain-containing protein n=1 Tax=Amanita thiersii Skay4041 TaxID=703135 RepID=A0A2A9NNE5_9AGAR|nr:hypothetical protein AMATHDRAFT_148175 [Amanita thiersii Skay4041]
MPHTALKPPPSHWPPHLQYTQSYRYHSSLTPAVRQFVQGTPSQKGQQQPSIRAQVIIREINITSHPACGQYGLFAAKKIPPRTHIIDYIGEVHCNDRPDSDYDLSLYRFQDGTSVGIDGDSMGNEARFINDYRGIKNKPNAMFVDARHTSGELRIGVWSLHEEIRKGEEILVSYGKSWWRARSRKNAAHEGHETPKDSVVYSTRRN